MKEKTTLNISNEQIKQLYKYLPDIEICITTGGIDTVLDRLDDKITEIGFTIEYELNDVGLELQRLYDELYNQN